MSVFHLRKKRIVVADEFKIFDRSYALPYLTDDDGSVSETKNKILLTATILFAQKGYAAVTVREVAQAVGVQAASLYNHFKGKEELWQAVIAHARDLYGLYIRLMEEEIGKATSFEEVLEAIFRDPENMSNEFTCYAFALAQSEQMRDEHARDMLNNQLIKRCTETLRRAFDGCIAKGMVKPFDTKAVAIMYSCTVLISVNLAAQELLGFEVPYEPTDAVKDLHHLMLESLQ